MRRVVEREERRRVRGEKSGECKRIGGEEGGG